MARPGGVKPAELAIGAGLVAISLILAIGALRFPPEMGFVVLGAHVYPCAVALFLGGVGVLLSYQAVTGGFRDEKNGEERVLRGGVAGAMWVTAGLILIAMLINVLGFVLAAGLLFACSARGFGSRHPLRDIAIGMALTLPIYWLFNAGLGVSLPALINAWI
ncbi:tripartite tricarboxylate transporter TctB family protein [Pseudomonas citri]|uniref:tripartite tricarboxylate transporter TctB family protein n=1 Tax=Pseudomonas citri TaxID=2978349 RepID=UPI0021B5913C|nr:tripartite tricarboxylate transporter TctB family protein [Pseudomonas citri]